MRSAYFSTSFIHKETKTQFSIAMVLKFLIKRCPISMCTIFFNKLYFILAFFFFTTFNIILTITDGLQLDMLLGLTFFLYDGAKVIHIQQKPYLNFEFFLWLVICYISSLMTLDSGSTGLPHGPPPRKYPFYYWLKTDTKVLSWKFCSLFDP